LAQELRTKALEHLCQCNGHDGDLERSLCARQTSQQIQW
jgi:hypothetical protein